MALVADFKLTAGYYINLDDPEQRLPLMQRLESDNEEVLLDGVRTLRVILKCSRQQKLQALKLDIPKRLLKHFEERNPISGPLALQILRVFSTIASNFSEGRDHLTGLGVPSLLLNLLNSVNSVNLVKSVNLVNSVNLVEEDCNLVEAALDCFRVIFFGLQKTKKKLIFSQNFKKQPENFRIFLVFSEKFPTACEIVCEMLTFFPHFFVFFAEAEFCPSVPAVLDALNSRQLTLKRASLLLLVYCTQNETHLTKLIHAFTSVKSVLSERVLVLLDPSEDAGFRLLALSLLTTLYKKRFPLCQYQTLSDTVLPMAARFCRKQMPISVRISAAEILACLLDEEPALQEIASYCDQLMISLAAYVKIPSLESVTEMRKRRKGQTGSLEFWPFVLSVLECGQELKRAAFLVFSALASSSETIRKRVSDVDGLVPAAVASMTDTNGRTAYAAFRLLHSLSRSTQLIRTVFKEHNVWEPCLSLLKEPSLSLGESCFLKEPSLVLSGSHRINLAIIASSIIANLSVEFSSCRTDLLKNNLLAILGELASHSRVEIVQNVAWTLMNLTYMADFEVKKSVEDVFSPPKILILLKHENEKVVENTVGMIRNLLHTAPIKEVVPLAVLPPLPDVPSRILRRIRGHAYPNVEPPVVKSSQDVMESAYCQELFMYLVQLSSEKNTNAKILQQIFSVFGNVSCSFFGKNLIFSNKNILDLIQKGLTHSDVGVAISAVACVNNLVLPEEDNGKEEKQLMSSGERQRKLIENNFMRDLTRLLTTADQHLFERVKTAIHFLNGSPK